MTKKHMCFICEVEQNMEVIERKETVTIKGKEVNFTAVLCRCPQCHEELETPEQLDANLEAAREAYALRYEIRSPDELVSLRAQYNASQKAFGLLLGFGELTMNTYEKGAFPDSTNRLLIHLAADPYCFRKMYEHNKNRIGETQRKRIEASAGFTQSKHWERMDSVYHALTAGERSSVERKANDAGISISSFVASCITNSLEQDYTDLIHEAKWNMSESSGVSFESHCGELAV